MKGYRCDDGTCTQTDVWEDKNACDRTCNPPPESGLLRINCVYYEANSWDGGEGHKAGDDFPMLVAVGVNVLSMAFYRPTSARPNPGLITAAGGAQNVTDYSKFGALIQRWGDALDAKKQRGHVYVSYGGASESSAWTDPFRNPAQFAENLIEIHQGITAHFKSPNCKFGFDLDIEDNGAADTIKAGFETFITTMRATLSAEECPIQVDSFSGVYNAGDPDHKPYPIPPSDDHYLFDIIKRYGPEGTSVHNGFQYQGLMVDSARDDGDKYLMFWNNPAWKGETILPYTSRVVNFYHDPFPTFFPADPENLLKWIRDNRVSVGWWGWREGPPMGGADPTIKLDNFLKVCEDGDFGSAGFVCSVPYEGNMLGPHCD